MASNNYNPYNYPYQQSAAQQYSTYQSAPASNNAAQSSRQYQQSSTPQGTDYMTYSGQTYGGQSSGYAAGQDSSWNSNSYGGGRETTSRAAEVLRNMSNTSYNPNSTSATNQPGFTSTSASNPQASRYATNTSRSPQVQAQQIHSSQAAYGQSQSRPRSVNTNQAQATTTRGLPLPATVAGYPPQRAQPVYGQQQQRSASPAQPQYNTTPVSSARSATVSASATQQYNDYNRRQLPGVEAPQSSHHNSSSSYNYGDSHMDTHSSGSVALPAPAASSADAYTAQSATTVDPMAVYDPWPEYQRKQDLMRAQRAAEDAARVEEARIAEEARKAEEAEKEAERKRQEDEEKARKPKPKPKKKVQLWSTTAAAAAASSTAESSAVSGDPLESEIRAMMAKMRELNSKDPALLARIWEEERRAKAPKSPTVQKSVPQAAAPGPVQAAPTITAPVANSRKKTVPRDSIGASAAKPTTVAPAQVVPVRLQTPAASNRSGGNTIWPPEKKAHLANAAATFLNTHNPDRSMQPHQILAMLDSNPSYIELCEQLESMGLALDRAAFAKNLLTAVPDVNSASRKAAAQPAPVPVHKAQVPPAVLKKDAIQAAASPQYAPATAVPVNGGSFSRFPASASPAQTPAPVAEMVPIKPELKRPANKEEAARKRNFGDLIDLTLLPDEDDLGPPPKKLNADAIHSYLSPYGLNQDATMVGQQPVVANFPTASAPAPPPQVSTPAAVPLPPSELRYRNYVEPLERKKALRRNTYNPATIARDVLLACGRHPTERQLNQHLDGLRTTLPHITFESDLSTIKWDLIDPGTPPPGYFKDSVQALAEDADDEDDSDNEDRDARAKSHSIGGESSSGAQARVQPLPEAINPFVKQKRRGRPPRHSLPNDTSPATPERAPSTSNMSASAPRPTSAAAGVGYQAFRSVTEYGPDGQPRPKKKGRPVGWRKAIHGSAAAKARPNANGHSGTPMQHQPSQPSSLRKVKTGEDEPIRVESRSPSVASRAPRYQSYKCKWHNCSAELHNLETLQKHVFKVHRKETLQHTLECLWGDCGKEEANRDPMTNMTIERHAPHSFDLESNWRSHIQERHFAPLSWELGDGPASGLSGKEDN